MISIVIPTYEANGNGWIFLTELLNSIHRQTFKDYEIIISDQSNDGAIQDVVAAYHKKIPIKYYNVYGMVPAGIGTNLNHAISKANGGIIKIMCGDDIFLFDKALAYIDEGFKNNPDSKWLVNSSMHFKDIHQLYRPFVPRYHDKIHLGVNTISSPSVLAMRVKEYFDEKLCLLIDCEMYKRLHLKYGDPIILDTYLVGNRVHKDQMQHKESGMLEKERPYCVGLYGE